MFIVLKYIAFSKPEIWVKNNNFGRKLEFWLKIKILVQKLKF